MPDLKTEMAKVINEWNKPESTTMTHPAVTNNVTRVTFDTVLQNPGITRADLIKRMSAKGYKNSSSSSMVTQLLNNGNIRYQGSGLFTTQLEYKPMARATPRQQRKLPAVAVAEIPTPTVQINSAWDADTILNHLSIKQARALYDELSKIFGGA